MTHSQMLGKVEYGGGPIFKVVLQIWKAMALSYNLGYQESISVHSTRRQIFAGKPYSTFPNI